MAQKEVKETRQWRLFPKDGIQSHRRHSIEHCPDRDDGIWACPAGLPGTMVTVLSSAVS